MKLALKSEFLFSKTFAKLTSKIEPDDSWNERKDGLDVYQNELRVPLASFAD